MVTNPVKTVTPCADAKDERSAETTKSATPVTAIRIFVTSVIAPGFALYRIGMPKTRFKPAWRRSGMHCRNAARHFAG